jgi:DNA-binding transcriptional regulator YiaG
MSTPTRYRPRKAPKAPKTQGERIKALRIARQMTQADLAMRLFTDQTTISSWERGKAEPSGAALAALCLLFAVGRETVERGEALEEALDAPPPFMGAAEGPYGGVDLPGLHGRPGAVVPLRDGVAKLMGGDQLKAALTRALEQNRPIWLVLGEAE